MNSCNFSCVYPTFEQFSGHGRLLSQSEWRQALEEEEEQKVRVGGGSWDQTGGGRSTVRPKAFVPATQNPATFYDPVSL